MDDESRSPRSEVVVASANTGTRPVAARASVMAAAETLLEYASVGRTDDERESAQWRSAEQTEEIELSVRGRLQLGAQRGAIFGGVNSMEGADMRNNGRADDRTDGITKLPRDDVAADRGWNQWSTGDILPPDSSHAETGFAFGGARIKVAEQAGMQDIPVYQIATWTISFCSGRDGSSSLRSKGSSSNLRNGSSKWKKNDGAQKHMSDELQRRSGSISRSSGVG